MKRKGFTLIELLIVVVIIGILVAIAIPKYAQTTEKAFIASIKSDLRNLVTGREAYFTDSLQYKRSTSCATPAPGDAAAWCSWGANMLGHIKLSRGGSVGWTASISNPNTATSCAISVGDVKNPEDPATSADPAGTPVCR